MARECDFRVPLKETTKCGIFRVLGMSLSRLPSAGCVRVPCGASGWCAGWGNDQVWVLGITHFPSSTKRCIVFFFF